MHAKLLQAMQMRKSSSLQSFRDYRRLETEAQQASVTNDGTLLEFETLELRLHPPNVVIDNESYEDCTVITIDSANRPGTLIEVVQCLTELNLSIRKARISSDGGWFVDEFFVSECPRGKVLHPQKLETIRKVLSVEGELLSSQSLPVPTVVFELSGRDKKGLMAGVLQLMASSGCEVQSTAVWTYHQQVALVVSVVDRQPSQQPPPPTPSALHPGAGLSSPGSSRPSSRAGLVLSDHDMAKMEKLTVVLLQMLGGAGEAHVTWELVEGEVHHERRLHHLLLQEEERCWEAQNMNQSLWGGICNSEKPAMTVADVDNAHTNLQVPLPDLASSTLAGSVYMTQSAGELPGPLVRPRSPAQPSHSVSAGSSPPPATGQPGLSSSGGNPPSLGSPSRDGSGGGSLVLQDSGLPLSSSSLSKKLSVNERSLIQEGSRGSQPTPFLPAPTAIAATDLLNIHAYLDSESVEKLLRADVRIQHSPLLKYYILTITCKDRNKLFFDTVCTLADMQYDVFHGAIDCDGDQASQLFYVRPRSGELVLDDMRVDQLAYMLEAAVQRRFPRGLRVHMHAPDRASIPSIFAALNNAGFSVTRAAVHTGVDARAFFDMTVADATGQVPSAAALQRSCEAAGGKQADELDALAAVASVGGAGAAAATAQRGGVVYGVGPSSTGTVPASAQQHAPSHQRTQSLLSGAAHMSLSVAQAQSVAAGAYGSAQPMAAPPRHLLPGKFQFQISGSHGAGSPVRRGPATSTASAATQPR